MVRNRLIVPFYQRDRWEREQAEKRIEGYGETLAEFSKRQLELSEMTSPELRAAGIVSVYEKRSSDA